jgi:NAD-dependent deacetylase
MKCKKRQEATPAIIEKIPPMCRCGGVLKPYIVFFGEEIPLDALLRVEEVSTQTDVLLVIGTTGEVFPASSIPIEVKERGASIIEVNTAPSSYTNTLIDIYLQGQATVILKNLEDEINSLLKNET